MYYVCSLISTLTVRTNLTTNVSRKDEFLALYEEHVKPVEDEAGEFSSDDEVISRFLS